MDKPFLYLSPEWCDEARTRLTEELSPERMNHVTSSLASLYRNCPDGKDRYMLMRYEKGVLEALEIGEGEPPGAEFRIIGDYETFAKITRAEMKSQIALMTGNLKLKGNMIKALKLASISDRFNKVLSRIPTTY